MLIEIKDPVIHTYIFGAVFLALFLLTLQRVKSEKFFSNDVTTDIKGFAILGIVLGHVGYFLSSDTRFLFPFSVIAGVGVNVFLFLSGLGLTLSQQKSHLPVFAFYRKRLSKLFLTLWVVLALFLFLDFIFLNRTYPLLEITRSFLGFYTRADLSANINSPLWYFTIILFYYLLFPIVFIRKLAWVSPLIVFAVSFFVLKLTLPVNVDVIKLYKLHIFAFPLGMYFALILPKIKDNLNPLVRTILLTLALIIFAYTAYHSGVGQSPSKEQATSLITTGAILVIFSLSKLRSKLFTIFGVYSYEIYLLHWPIFSRFNLYKDMPPSVMVLLNLLLIVLLSYCLQKVTTFISRRI